MISIFLVPPTNTMSPSTTVQALSPQSATLSCTAEGLPLPTFTWNRVRDSNIELTFKSNTTTLNSKTYSISTSMGASNFTIAPTSAVGSGTYSCVAMNRLGTDAGSVNLIVYGESFNQQECDMQ